MNYKKYLNAVKVSDLLEKQCSTSGAAFFLSIGSSMTAIKMETSAMNMWSEIMTFYGDAVSSQLSSGMNQI